MIKISVMRPYIERGFSTLLWLKIHCGSVKERNRVYSAFLGEHSFYGQTSIDPTITSAIEAVRIDQLPRKRKFVFLKIRLAHSFREYDILCQSVCDNLTRHYMRYVEGLLMNAAIKGGLNAK